MLTGIIPGRLKELTTDASTPEAGGHCIIANVVDESGTWGSNDFHLKLAKRWPQAQTEYRRGYYGQSQFKLGLIQEINVRSDLTIVNLIALKDGEIDKDAIESCMKKLADLAKYNKSSIHLSKEFYWENLLPLVTDVLLKQGLNVTAYGSSD